MSAKCWAYLLIALFASLVYANTEKAVFIAPQQLTLSDLDFQSQLLKLESLSHPVSSLLTSLPVAFPDQHHPQGVDSWFLLRGLNEGQRYEVRVCWAAIQPTTIRVDVFSSGALLAKSELRDSLSTYVNSRRQVWEVDSANSPLEQQSILALRVQAAADFYSTNSSLMLHPPHVDVDIILDRFLLNAFPQTLLPTAAYILLLAVGGFYIAGVIVKPLDSLRASKAHED